MGISTNPSQSQEAVHNNGEDLLPTGKEIFKIDTLSLPVEILSSEFLDEQRSDELCKSLIPTTDSQKSL